MIIDLIALSKWTACVVIGIGLTGCASSAGHLATTQPAINQFANDKESEMKKPFLFDEASLPAGFPLPGPVNEVIVKTYPPARAARVTSRDLGGKADENRLFSPLFNHIKKNNIPMSSPVEMTRDNQTRKADSMAFFYGNTAVGKPGPDEQVQVVDLPAVTVISVGVRGSYDQDHFEAGVKKLNAWLTTNGKQYKVVGPPRMLGYNSPFVPWFLRYSEVQLPIEPVGH